MENAVLRKRLIKGKSNIIYCSVLRNGTLRSIFKNVVGFNT